MIYCWKNEKPCVWLLIYFIGWSFTGLLQRSCSFSCGPPCPGSLNRVLHLDLELFDVGTCVLCPGAVHRCWSRAASSSGVAFQAQWRWGMDMCWCSAYAAHLFCLERGLYVRYTNSKLFIMLGASDARGSAPLLRRCSSFVDPRAWVELLWWVALVRILPGRGRFLSVNDYFNSYFLRKNRDRFLSSNQ